MGEESDAGPETRGATGEPTSDAAPARIPTRIVGRRDAGGDLVLVELAVDPRAAASYARPGQYVEVRAGEKRGYFALAGEAGASSWELLVGRGGEVAARLRESPLGTAIDASDAAGRGFPYEAASSRPLIVAATGSGLAALRPLVRRRLVDGLAASTHAYVGVRTLVDVPLPEEIAAWRREGMNVTVCLSREPRVEGPGTFAGYVQHAIVHHHGAAEAGLPDAHVFAVGAPAMLEQLREVVPCLGIRREDVHTNY